MDAQWLYAIVAAAPVAAGGAQHHNQVERVRFIDAFDLVTSLRSIGSYGCRHYDARM